MQPRMEILFVVLFAYLRQLRSDQLHKLADAAATKAKLARPVVAK